MILVSTLTKKPKRHSKIELLPQIVRDLIDQAAERGESAEKIASLLRAEEKIKISDDSVRRYMRRLLTKNIHQGLNQYRNFLKDLPEQVDALKTLAEGIVMQKARLGMMVNKEKSSEKTFTSTDKALEVLRELASDLAELEMRMGIRKCVAPNSGGVAGGSDEDIAKMIGTIVETTKEKKPAESTTNCTVEQPAVNT